MGFLGFGDIILSGLAYILFWLWLQCDRILPQLSQKLKRVDTVRIANAVQDAKLEGLGISLVLCGLPSAYRKLRSYKDCTFIHRMQREKLWTMPQGETMGCLQNLFGKIPEIALTREQLREIGRFTGGRPYLIQLVGDHLYRLADDALFPIPGASSPVPDDMIEIAESAALVTRIGFSR